MCLAIPGRILTMSGDDPLQRTASVDFGGIIKEVSLIYLPEATTGDYVIVHAGFAISTVDETVVDRVVDYLEEVVSC